ncbi:hypothetical protein DS2_00025 [Catenovulum agarivorans DS-2]|uniref:Transglutaminase-like domain-containing protein n=1 Tax=Catenovulum agarivorans DS-2 TaxID=1328313 RepID=W7QWE5_9ALTE|nr:transglutaminase-like domain-containing protein [Catenovulum agarivorans]EWH12063.1 hypothetical protein DS2_00025 [Catenovulum agarivorans DS-2]
MITKLTTAVFAICISVYCNTAYAQSIPSISSVKTTLADGQTLPLANKIAFEWHANNSQKVIEQFEEHAHIQLSQIADGRLEMFVSQWTNSAGEFLPRHKADSFVIDISEKSTQAFVAGFNSKHTQPIELHQLTSYVANYIDKPTYIHGFNFASKVANQRSGDCTEYAVLTTALARSLDLPARVMIGIVIVEETDKVQAFGHAWAEIWQQGHWQIADAALLNSAAQQHFYLPTGEITNEGPGYAMSLFRSVTLMPSEISNLRTVKVTTTGAEKPRQIRFSRSF